MTEIWNLRGEPGIVPIKLYKIGEQAVFFFLKAGLPGSNLKKQLERLVAEN